MSKHWSVDDIIRVRANSGGYRVYRVIAILLGGEDQESVIEIETLDRKATAEGRLLVPEEILNAKRLEG